MGSKWRKAKMALGRNLCVYVPHVAEDEPPSSSEVLVGRGISDSSSVSPGSRKSDCRVTMPMTPTPSSSGLRLGLSSKKICAICLTTMKPGQGHAIFTAECSHSFHFHCITSNVKHGNQICPVCRAKWKEIPFQSPVPDGPHGRARSVVNWPQNDAWTTVIRRLPSPRPDANRHASSLLHAPEPGVFDDDEQLDYQHGAAEKISSTRDVTDNNSVQTMEIRTVPEVSAVPKSSSHDNFSILIHLKAPLTGSKLSTSNTQGCLSSLSQNSRASIDLVTVLDVSGSMAGTKLALLKRAMGFVIQNLGPSDRLSVIAFSSTARRLFPLQRMTYTGRQHALQAVNSLTSNGGTNIAEGLKKGVKVLLERKGKNPVSSIILLSDGQDTYTVSSPGGSHHQRDYHTLLPISINQNGGASLQIPVHAFGFGADHDSASLHSISENSGGTFSFVEAESVIQDAFAQCIGGLLSVVVQELQIRVECTHPSLRLGSIKAGSYRTGLTMSARVGCIEVGDLYAEEERDFLVFVNIPPDNGCNEMSLLKVRCIYRDPITKEMVNLDEDQEVKIQRPETTGQLLVSMEVDRQRNRLRAAEAMAEARAAAEGGDLSGAVSILENFRRILSETVSAQAGDRLCVALGAELKEMQERMANRRVYETSGRAYVLSGLSSHSWQRATARGDSTESASLVQAYQTPSMVDMVTRSQTMFFGSPSPQPPKSLRQSLSFGDQPRPR
ncbi:von Willebrand factor, type A [Dillenia turbinata]|uniref:von Willebrand factor, type A n=1 Tax=Dillenia turbinata TaxID=194707 RepID=A0AAN8V3D1_9MAGN